MKHTATLVAGIAGVTLGLLVGFHRNPPEPLPEIVIPATATPAQPAPATPSAPAPAPTPAPSTPSPELSKTSPELPHKASQRPSETSTDSSLRTELTQKRVLQEAQLQTLSSYDGEQLHLYAASMDTPENPVKTLYPQLQDAKQTLDHLTSTGFGPRHPSVIAQQAVIDSMRKDLDSATAQLRDLLKMQIDTANAALQNLPADH
jgi:hypothetical protein